MCDRALGKTGAPAVDLLIEAARDSSIDGVRRLAVSALGEIKDNRVIDPLISALKDTSDLVRGDAADSLAKTNERRAIDPLVATLNAVDDLRNFNTRRRCDAGTGNYGRSSCYPLDRDR